jgi:hypothetical protein
MNFGQAKETESPKATQYRRIRSRRSGETSTTACYFLSEFDHFLSWKVSYWKHRLLAEVSRSICKGPQFGPFVLERSGLALSSPENGHAKC